MGEHILKKADASAKLQAISRVFVNARRNAQMLDRYPGHLPETLEDAYEIQEISVANWNEKPAGWKIGMVPLSFRHLFLDERIIGPIFPSHIKQRRNGEHASMPIFKGGFAAVEGEFIYQLTDDIPAGSLPGDNIIERVGAMHIGVEIASSPLQSINDLGPVSVISDFGNNAGLIVGPAIHNWQERKLSDLPVKVMINEKMISTATAEAIPGGPQQALLFLVRKCAELDVDLHKGDYVSTGAVTGVHDVSIGDNATILFGDDGALSVDFSEATSARA